MGMYDTVYSEVPLPNGAEQHGPEQHFAGGSLQTKDFDCAMDHYVITSDGRLEREVWHWETVPEQERPYYGTDDWKIEFFQLAGSMRRVVTGREDVHYHGDFEMIGPSMKFYVARFTEGKLAWIREIVRQPDVIQQEAL